jgi:hypothetical protein
VRRGLIGYIFLKRTLFRRFKALAVAKFSAWHRLARRVIFVKTDAAFPPECFLVQNITGICKITVSIETLCGGKVNQNEKTVVS